MLVAAITLSALPVSACVLSLRTTHTPACCRTMATECSGPSGAVQGSCCQIRPQPAASNPVTPFVHERVQSVAGTMDSAWILTADSVRNAACIHSDTPPPLPSSRGSSILRI